jgi:hypothetical protein
MKTETVLVLAAVGVGAWWWWWNRSKKQQATGPRVQPAASPLPAGRGGAFIDPGFALRGGGGIIDPGFAPRGGSGIIDPGFAPRGGSGIISDAGLHRPFGTPATGGVTNLGLRY